MAVGSPPTVRRRQLGRELRRLREQRGMLAEALADKLRCSPSRISRIETARVRITPGVVHEILDVLDAGWDDRRRLVDLAREAEQPGWWQAYTDVLPYEYSTFIAFESEAASLKVFEPSIVFGPLQIPTYARALIAQGGLDDIEVNARLAARVQRQALLTKANGPKFHIVLDEAVVHHQIGGQDVMDAQLSRLLEVSGFPSVTLQVLPFHNAVILGQLTAPMVFMEFPEPSDDPVVYIENSVGDVYVDRPDEIHKQVAIFDRLVAAALPVSETRTLLSSLRSGVS